MSSTDRIYMQRAIELANKGTRLAFPNPSVGAVLVCDYKIIGEGYTSPYGGAHAEVNAINSVKDVTLLDKATLYVTLEPCSHYGKTPPCSLLIIEKQIPRIVVGCIDTFSEVSGRGIKMLLEAGREVVVGCLEKECLEVHKRFLTFHNKQRPYIILKWAETKDGFLDVDREVFRKKDAQPTWISNELSRQLVHQLRAEEHAIMVGTNTALKDNPSLTTRSVKGKNPVRILIDRTLKVPQDYHLYSGEVETIVFTEKDREGAGVTYSKIDFSGDVLPQILEVLYQKNIQSVIVEGGSQLLSSFVNEDLWDEIFVFKGVAEFKSGVYAPKVSVKPIKVDEIGGDLLKHFKK